MDKNTTKTNNKDNRFMWDKRRQSKIREILDPKWDSMMYGSNFWIRDPIELVRSPDIVFNASMTNNEKLNVITRIIFIITVVMIAVKFPMWWLFLIASIIFILIIWAILEYWDKYERERCEKTGICKPVYSRIIEPIFNKTTGKLNLKPRINYK